MTNVADAVAIMVKIQLARNLQIFILLMQLQLVNRKLKIEVSKRMFAADETN